MAASAATPWKCLHFHGKGDATERSRGLSLRSTSSSGVCVDAGPVVQLVRTPPCHGGGRGFESLPGRRCVMVVSAACQPFGLPLRDFVAYDLQALAAAVSKLPRQTKLSGRTYSRFARGLSSAGRAPALQAGGRWFKSNRPHQMPTWLNRQSS